MLVSLATRPGTYVGRPSIFLVSTYLDGYCHSRIDLGMPDPMYGWGIWVLHRYLIWSPAWGWPRVLLHVYGTHLDALAALPNLYKEFVSQCDSLNVEALEADLRRQLIDKYGRDYYAPEQTHTTDAP